MKKRRRRREAGEATAMAWGWYLHSYTLLVCSYRNGIFHVCWQRSQFWVIFFI